MSDTLVNRKMLNSTKNISASLDKLSKLLKIDLNKGGKTTLAAWFGVTRTSFSRWYHQDKMDIRYIAVAEEKGFPPDAWLVPRGWADKKRIELEEKALSNFEWHSINKRVSEIIVASFLDRSTFYHMANISPCNASDGYPLGQNPSLNTPAFVKKIADTFDYNEDWIWSGEANPRKQRITPDDEKYINMTREILRSEETGTILALKSNIRQFHEQIKDKQRIRLMDQNLQQLSREINKLKTINDGCAADPQLSEAEGE